MKKRVTRLLRLMKKRRVTTHLRVMKKRVTNLRLAKKMEMAHLSFFSGTITRVTKVLSTTKYFTGESCSYVAK